MESTPRQGSVPAKITLGCIHLVLGAVLLGSRYFGSSDLIMWLTEFSSSLPTWALLILGFVKGVYGAGAYVPGTTIILLFFLGHECSFTSTSQWIILTWLGVVVGLSFSYAMGLALSRSRDEKQFHWRDLAFGVHPNLIGIYFFERGFWQRDFKRALSVFAMFGLVFLTIASALICSFKSIFLAQTEEIGVMWGLVLIVLGIWRIGHAIYSR